MVSARRTWTAAEKASALDYYHETRSKKRVCRDMSIPCTKMLRDWLRAEPGIRAALLRGDSDARRVRAPAVEAGATAVEAARGSRAYVLRRLGGGGEASEVADDGGETELEEAEEGGVAAEKWRSDSCAASSGTRVSVGESSHSAAGDSSFAMEDKREGKDEDEEGRCRVVPFCVRKRTEEASAEENEASSVSGDDGSAEDERKGEACMVFEGPRSRGRQAAGGAAATSDAGAVAGAGTGAPLFGAQSTASIPLAGLDALVELWLTEDCPAFDYGGAVVGQKPVRAVLFAKSPGMLAGSVFFDRVFTRLGCAVAWEAGFVDGATLALPPSGKLPIAIVTGPANLVLQGERVALNSLAECSGIATAAARMTAAAREAGWAGRLAGTRKTTPGFRLVQKYGMMVGGMDTHRMDLSSMIMLKDNHIAAAGSIPAAICAAKAVGGFSLKVDVECGDLETARIAAGAGASVVMLDNFSAADFCATAKILRAEFPHLIIEGSGGLTESTLSDYMCPEADVLSFSVNRYASSLDMSLKIPL